MLPFNIGHEDLAKQHMSKTSDPDLVAQYEPDTEKAIVLKMMMDTLLKKNVIVKMKKEEQGFFNRVFLRPKKAPDTETRMEKKMASHSGRVRPKQVSPYQTLHDGDSRKDTE